MQAPDALSRNPVDADASPSVRVEVIDLPEIRDPWYLELRRKVLENPDAYEKFRVDDDRLFKLITIRAGAPLRWVQLVPQEARLDALARSHDAPTSGHGGAFRTLERLRAKAYWPNMKEDVDRYVKSCATCQRVKKSRDRPPGFMGSGKIISRPGEVLSADLIGPGAPRLLLCDNGKQYRSREFQSLCRDYHTAIRYNIPYNPRSNPTERTNQTLETIVCCYVREENQRTWDEYLPEIQAAMNTSVSHVTGLSPHQVVFGEDLLLDGRERLFNGQEEQLDTADPEPLPPERVKEREELLARIREKIKHASARNAQRYNLRRREGDEFNAGDMVWKKTFPKSDKSAYYSKKLAPRWEGPYRVKYRVGRVSYALEDDRGKESGPWHVDQLKKYVTRNAGN
ncbi:hypothetical protein ONE63_008370 [Megalurothrips usitatus]|uniref:RNA-directed DNA polymerase n=1 Tax=Megalurothrips usitatus TaxID=439358 RepID=A0AAV7XKW8_9NEOP|nr:hypothetical protein ONE63_008370 [Megalurothrips usitatus]